MSNYGWTNEAGEPIMSGEAYRFEQQLDADSRDDYYADHFYDNEPNDDYGVCDECGDDYGLNLITDVCESCGAGQGDVHDEQDAPFVMEDQWLDSYMEDRMTTMFGE
jgi:hypothetical protein